MKRTHSVRPQVEHLEAIELLATYYVSNSGNNAGAGTAAAPWLTLQHAANTVRPGDLVIVRAGNYAGFDLQTDGTAAARITFRGEPGATITSPNARTADGINLEGADYITIEGFKVQGMPRAGIRTVANHHVIIKSNVAQNNGRWGIFSGFSEDLTITSNFATNSQLEHGIYVSNSADRPIITFNYVFGNRASGIQINADVTAGGDGIITGAVVERNTIYNNGAGGGSGINLDGVQSSRIQNNLLFNNHASGISLFRINAAEGSKNNTIVNNTVVQAADGRWALNINDASTGNIVRNNILMNQHSWRGSLSISADSLPGLVSDYNMVMDRFSRDGGDTRLGLAAWRQATGQDAHSGIATLAQLFVAPAQNNYLLATGSPARDAGTSASAPPIDLQGRPRPAGAGYDIGAYEMPVTAPLARAATASPGARTGLAAAAWGSTGGTLGATKLSQFLRRGARLAGR
jgi:hypothetical protein